MGQTETKSSHNNSVEPPSRHENCTSLAGPPAPLARQWVDLLQLYASLFDPPNGLLEQSETIRLSIPNTEHGQTWQRILANVATPITGEKIRPILFDNSVGLWRCMPLNLRRPYP